MRVSHAMWVELDPAFDVIVRTETTLPYSEDELERLLLWTRALSPTMEKRTLVLPCPGAGAGLSPDEIVRVRAPDLVFEGGALESRKSTQRKPRRDEDDVLKKVRKQRDGREAA